MIHLSGDEAKDFPRLETRTLPQSPDKFFDAGTQLLANKTKVHAKLERDWDPQKATRDVMLF